MIIERFEVIDIHIKNREFFPSLDLLLNDLLNRMIPGKMRKSVGLYPFHRLCNIKVHTQLHHERAKGPHQKIVETFFMTEHEFCQLVLLCDHDDRDRHEMGTRADDLDKHLATDGFHIARKKDQVQHFTIQKS